MRPSLRRTSGTLVLLFLAACGEHPAGPLAPGELDQPDAATQQEAVVLANFENHVESPRPQVPEGMLAIHTPNIRIAGVGANTGNRAANAIIGSGDIHGTITRIGATTFNSMTPAQLRAAYDVLIITWATSPVLNADWATRIEPYLELGGGVIWEDPNNMSDLAPAFSSGCCGGFGWIMVPFPPVTDGIVGTFANEHFVVDARPPWASVYIRNNNGSHSGVIGEIPTGQKGRIAMHGPDHDFHAFPGSDQYRLLLQEILWVSGATGAPQNTPPTADAGGPYTGDEGSPVLFDGSASDDADGDALTYAWDFGDGNAGTGATPSHSYGDNGTYTVTLTVDDGNGGTATATSTAVIDNVAPAVDAGSGATIESGDAFSLSGSFTDPGQDDSPFTSLIDWGDGSTDPGTGGSHVYLATGTYTVTLTVTDKDGDSGSDQVEVQVTRKDVAIDIKPGSDRNPVNLGSGGVLPVAIFTTADFDAASIDRATLAFGPAGATPVHGALGHLEDVDGDGDLDLVTHFETGDTGLTVDDTSACLTGATTGGVLFEGCDAVAPKEPKGKGKP